MSIGKDLTSCVPHVHIIRSVSLTMMDRSMIDVASRGALMEKTPAAARHLISNMASNTQYGAAQPRMVNDIGIVDNLRLENQLTELTSLVRQLVVVEHQPSIVARSASSRKLAIFRGPDEAASNKKFEVPTNYELQQHAILAKYEHHHPRPQDGNRIASQYCEPFIVGRIYQLALTNNSESKRECECHHSEKWKRIATANTAITAKTD
ncbi:hypothetical protein CR513_30743, partial [Mucuna pruriens]